MNYLTPVAVPPKSTFNKGLSSPNNAYMKSILGSPVIDDKYDPNGNDTPINNPVFKAQVATMDVGPFKVRGLKVALASLIKVCVAVEHSQPDLYALLGQNGMLVARFTRIAHGKTITIGPNISNHSWGTAIDIELGGITDKQGDGKTLQGLIDLSTTFNAFGWYWGAGFPTEDSMHFEVSKEKLEEWQAAGLLKK